MALVPFKINNFTTEVDEIITTQFGDKDVFKRYLKLITDGCNEMIEELRSLMQKRDIDTAQGAQLDIIGNIVGQPRTLVNADLTPFFGFKEHLAARSFGTTYNSSIGGYWWSYGKPIGDNVELNDIQYRQLIKAKIIKNNSKGLNEDYIKFGNFVLNANVSFDLDDGANSNTTVLIGRQMTLFEEALMVYVFEGQDYNWTYTPKPLGVGVVVDEYDALGTLGFFGTVGAKGMITLAFPYDGGVFADAYFLNNED